MQPARYAIALGVAATLLLTGCDSQKAAENPRPGRAYVSPAPSISSSLPDGFVAVKTYRARLGDREYIVIGAEKCANNPQARGVDWCADGGKSAVFVQGDSLLKLGETDFGNHPHYSPGFRWEGISAEQTGTTLHIFADITVSGGKGEYKRMDIYTFDGASGGKALGAAWEKILYDELDGESPREIVGFDYAAFRTAPEIAVFKWDGARYERDYEINRKIIMSLINIDTIARQAINGNEEAARREMAAYLNNFELSEQMERIILLSVAQHSEMTGKILKRMGISGGDPLRFLDSGISLESLALGVIDGLVSSYRAQSYLQQGKDKWSEAYQAMNMPTQRIDGRNVSHYAILSCDRTWRPGDAIPESCRDAIFSKQQQIDATTAEVRAQQRANETIAEALSRIVREVDKGLEPGSRPPSGQTGPSAPSAPGTAPEPVKGPDAIAKFNDDAGKTLSGVSKGIGETVCAVVPSFCQQSGQ